MTVQRKKTKLGPTRSPVTHDDTRAVKTYLAPVIDAVNGKSILSNSNKPDTPVNVSSQIVGSNKKDDFLLRTAV
jgi:hypothetical protein